LLDLRNRRSRDICRARRHQQAAWPLADGCGCQPRRV